MPELPEVETIVNRIRPSLKERTITNVTMLWEKTVCTPHDDFMRNIMQQKIMLVGRRGKYLRFTLSHENTLLIHLRMSGKITVQAKHEPLHKHVRLYFDLNKQDVYLLYQNILLKIVGSQ